VSVLAPTLPTSDVLKGIDVAIEALLRGDGHELDAYLTNVQSNVKLVNTKATVHCHIISMDGNDRPRVKGLARKLAITIMDYAIPRSDIEKAKEYDKRYNTTVRVSELKVKAKGLFTEIKNSGEGGELLLYMLLQTYLKLPQLLCKMPLKTSKQVHYHGVDGIHVSFDKLTGKLCLYWGESKLYNSIDKAISDCLDSIQPFLCDSSGSGAAQERDLQLLTENINLINEDLENALLSFLNPDDVNFKKLQYRGACLIGFDSGTYPLMPNKKTEQDLVDEVKIAFDSWKDKLNKKINKRSPLETFILEIFLVPFPSVQEFRDAFLEELRYA
jgi:hypothetical protein